MSIREISVDKLRRMEDQEGLIIQGCGGDLQEWVDGINEILTEEGILKKGTKFEDVYSFQRGEVTCLLFPFKDAYLDFRESDILRLHEIMMSMTGYEFGGRYKTNDNYILEEDAQGNRRIRFRPTPAKQAMEQLELAYMAARNDGNINQLLLIPCVILDFLCIHPFRDGNGRMSRLLSLLLLYKNDYDVGKPKLSKRFCAFTLI